MFIYASCVHITVTKLSDLNRRMKTTAISTKWDAAIPQPLTKVSRAMSAVTRVRFIYRNTELQRWRWICPRANFVFFPFLPQRHRISNEITKSIQNRYDLQAYTFDKQTRISASTLYLVNVLNLQFKMDRVEALFVFFCFWYAYICTLSYERIYNTLSKYIRMYAYTGIHIWVYRYIANKHFRDNTDTLTHTQ